MFDDYNKYSNVGEFCHIQLSDVSEHYLYVHIVSHIANNANLRVHLWHKYILDLNLENG